MQKSDFYVSRDGDNIELKVTTQGQDPSTGKKTIGSTKAIMVRSEAALLADMLREPERSAVKLSGGGTIEVCEQQQNAACRVIELHDVSADNTKEEVFCEHGGDLTKLIDDLREASLSM